MRALGPGSVSSFLAVILDVARWVLIIAAGAVSLAVVPVLLLSFDPTLVGEIASRVLPGMDLKGPWIGPLIAALLLVVDLNLAGALVIIGRLRRVFQTLIAGDPFHPDNVRRLRIIAAALAGLELSRYVLAALAILVVKHLGLDADQVDVNGDISINTWFSVLVIAVLAEVFREGARLRRESELTI